MTITQDKIRTSLTQTVAPTALPVSLAEQKEHARITDDGENSKLSDLLSACTNLAQNATGRQFVTATYEWVLDSFPPHSGHAMEVPRAPLQSVTSITYVDQNGDTQTWDAADYDVDTASEPGLIFPAFDEIYPATQNHPQAVTVTFVAGYGSASDVPQEKKAIIKWWTHHLYEHPDAIITGSIVAELPGTLQDLIREDSLNVST